MNGHDLEKNEKPDVEILTSSRIQSCERLSMESYHSNQNHVFFREHFYFRYSQYATEYVTIELSNNAMFIHAEGVLQRLRNWYINPADIIGGTIIDKEFKMRINGAIETFYELRIFIFQKKTNKSCSKKCVRSFRFKSLYHTNIQILKEWKELISNLAKDILFLEKYGDISINEINPYNVKNLLIIINPNAGRGVAQRLITEYNPILEKSGYKLEIVTTRYSKHAYEYILNLSTEKIQQFFGIVSVSGDGLPHEIINALLKRSDWESIKNKIGIAFLPGGSGNGMSKNITYFSKEECNFENLIYILCKGNQKEIDLLYFQMKNYEPVYGILSMEWAFMADIDIESEGIRLLGESRFAVWAVWRLFFLRTYRARLSYTTHEVNLKDFQVNKQLPDNNDWVHIDDVFSHFFISNVPYISPSDNISPLSISNDGFMEIQMIRGSKNVGRWNMLKFLLNLDKNGSVINLAENKPWDKSGLEYFKIRGFRLEPYGDKLGIFTIDGELYDSNIIQGCVINKALRIFTL